MKLDREGAVLRLGGDLTVEDAENLLVVLQDAGSVELDLADCQCMHAACLQVLMALKVKIAVWPSDHDLEVWLKRALQPSSPATPSE